MKRSITDYFIRSAPAASKQSKGDKSVSQSESDVNHNECTPSAENHIHVQQECSVSPSAENHIHVQQECSVSIINQSLPDNEQREIIEKLFPNEDLNKIHHYVLCHQRHCCSLSKSEKKFEHSLLTSKDLSYCHVTRLWNFIFVEGQGIYCLLCKKHNIKNIRNKSSVFAETPSTRFRKLALQEHLKCQKHIDAQYNENLNRVSVFQKEINHKEENQNNILFQAFYSHLFVVDQMIANFKINKLLQFVEHIGLNDLKYFNHRSAGSQKEIILTISDTLKSGLIEKLQKVNCYGLMIDDLSDVSSLEQMITYIQYVDPVSKSVQVDFLCIANLLEHSDSADSKTLFTVLMENLESMKLNVNKVSGLCTDGASDTLGKRDGLGARLKRENKKIIATHCVCHRLALACTDTNSALKCIGNIETHMLHLWKLFHYSPKKMACFLRHLEGYRQIILEANLKQKCTKILKKACKTRWLSFEASINAVMEDFIPLVQTLNELSESDTAAYGLLKRLNEAHFVGLVFIACYFAHFRKN